ncbi:MAG: hypothetical protein HYW14_03545 [Planctomycetes bacterium]|nr:hypothetical protein [Planctomycetota bacterium]
MEKLLGIDRRIIFVFVAVAAITPMLLRFEIPIPTTSIVKRVYDKIESLPEGSHVLIAFDYDPSSKEELLPMAIALMHHCFQRNLKAIGMTLNVTGKDLAEQAMSRTAALYGKESGKDYVFLGYKAGFYSVIAGMGQNIYSTFPKDAYGNNTRELPALERVETLRDIDYVIDLAAGDSTQMWIVYGKEKYKFDFGAGCTAVIGPEMYPFFQSRQINGFLSGLKDAAEYEALVKQKAQAVRGMPSQSITHLIVIFFVLFGNVVYFLTGKRKGQGKR